MKIAYPAWCHLRACQGMARSHWHLAARKLVEIAGVEAVQDGRVYIERVNEWRGAGQSPAHRKTRRRVESAGGRYKANDTAFRTVTLRRQRARLMVTAPALKGKPRDRSPPLPVLGHRGARLCGGRAESSVQPRLPLATTWSFKPA